jgi:isopentenyldiphosphate isomerase
MEEFMDIVDDNDTIIGNTTQKEIYDKKLTHRIVHVFLIDPKTNKIYLQKRSENKDFLPGYYCTSAGGHVKSGETYEEAGKRELEEELGLKIDLKEVTKLEFVSDNHKRLIRLFTAYINNENINFKDGEVSGGQFIDLDKAYKLVNTYAKIHPQLRLCLNWLYQNKGLIKR